MQHNCAKRMELGGEDLTRLLLKEMSKQDPELKLDFTTAELLKETASVVSEDYSTAMESCSIEEHILPDGQVCFLGKK